MKRADMRRAIVILLANLALATHAADEPKSKPANSFDHAIEVIGQEATTVAHAAKQAGKDIGHAASRAAKEIAGAFRKSDKETKETSK